MKLHKVITLQSIQTGVMITANYLFQYTYEYLDRLDKIVNLSFTAVYNNNSVVNWLKHIHC